MTQYLPPLGVAQQSKKMHWTGRSVFIVLACLIASRSAGALSVDTNGNRTENNNVTDVGGFVPVVFTKVSQIIAREGSCALIDCNVTGDPFPTVEWFNSHGVRLDTQTRGEEDFSLNKTCSLVSFSFFFFFNLLCGLRHAADNIIIRGRVQESQTNIRFQLWKLCSEVQAVFQILDVSLSNLETGFCSSLGSLQV